MKARSSTDPHFATFAPYKSDVTILSNLTHNTGRALLDGPGDHGRCCGSYLTGIQVKKTLVDIRAGLSCDQIVANQVGQQTRFPSLEIGLEDARQAGDCDSGYSCAYTNNLAWRSETQPLPPVLDPKALFERLFGDAGLTRSSVPEGTTIAGASWFVSEDTKSLQSGWVPSTSASDEYQLSPRNRNANRKSGKG
jgi:hypothetical protein